MTPEEKENKSRVNNLKWTEIFDELKQSLP
jgi:hypothetical protein